MTPEKGKSGADAKSGRIWDLVGESGVSGGGDVSLFLFLWEVERDGESGEEGGEEVDVDSDVDVDSGVCFSVDIEVE